MRYLSLILLLALMGLSWATIHKPTFTAEWVHWSLQKELKDIIARQIKIKYPRVTNIKFDKIWTENIQTNKVKALFKYSYEESSQSRVQIQGHAMLERQRPNGNSEKKTLPWTITEIHISNEHILYR